MSHTIFSEVSFSTKGCNDSCFAATPMTRTRLCSYGKKIIPSNDVIGTVIKYGWQLSDQSSVAADRSIMNELPVLCSWATAFYSWWCRLICIELRRGHRAAFTIPLPVPVRFDYAKTIPVYRKIQARVGKNTTIYIFLLMKVERGLREIRADDLM